MSFKWGQHEILRRARILTSKSKSLFSLKKKSPFGDFFSVVAIESFVFDFLRARLGFGGENSVKMKKSFILPQGIAFSKIKSPTDAPAKSRIFRKTCFWWLSVQPLVQPLVQPSVQPSVQPLVQPSVQPLVQPWTGESAPDPCRFPPPHFYKMYAVVSWWQ